MTDLRLIQYFEVVYRLLSWNPWAGVLLRLAQTLRTPMRC